MKGAMGLKTTLTHFLKKMQIYIYISRYVCGDISIVWGACMGKMSVLNCIQHLSFILTTCWDWAVYSSLYSSSSHHHHHQLLKEQSSHTHTHNRHIYLTVVKVLSIRHCQRGLEPSLSRVAIDYQLSLQGGRRSKTSCVCVDKN